MSIGARTVNASHTAEELAAEMLSKHDVMWAILDETIPDEDDPDPVVRESGRTFCGGDSNVRGPLARFPTAVELAECPRGTKGGTWHSHVTRDQLRNPTNSLPDTANVMFGDVDVSIVVGTQTAEAVIAPQNRKKGVDVFQDALGADVSNTDGVVDAILAGHIPDPTDARQRVRRRMPNLFKTTKLNFHDLNGRVERASIPAHSMMGFEMVEAQRYHSIQRAGVRHRDHSKNPVRDPSGMRGHLRTTNKRAKAAAGEMGVPEKARDATVAAIIQRAVSALLP